MVRLETELFLQQTPVDSTNGVAPKSRGKPVKNFPVEFVALRSLRNCWEEQEANPSIATFVGLGSIELCAIATIPWNPSQHHKFSCLNFLSFGQRQSGLQILCH